MGAPRRLLATRPARLMSMLIATLIALVLVAGGADAQVAPATNASTAAARATVTAAEKRCLASRRRVERQNEALTQAAAREEKEHTARAVCKTKRACENLDRAIKASDVRRERLAKQLAQLEAEATKVCELPPTTLSGYRSNTAVTGVDSP
ncbi:MAG TPA: hypothetical protein VNG69_09425, partial [Casimicrobiaceae bacterium]|nr:hypothetical protein [Casimicrobiaceae bacterium]